MQYVLSLCAGTGFVMSRTIRKSPARSYTIKLAEPHQLPDVLQIMRDNFYHDETMFKSLCSSASVSESERIRIDEYFDGTIEAAFSTSPCIVAVDDETSQVVGVNITASSGNPKTGNKTDGLATIFSSKISIPPLVEKYIEYLSKFNDEAKLFDKFPNARAVWEFYAIAIDKSHRKLGLASDLMNVGIAFAREAQVALVFGVFTSVYSKKSAEKVGMRTIMEFDLSSYKDATGTTIFKDTEPHNIVSVMVLEI